jgi:hypothetical protein
MADKAVSQPRLRKIETRDDPWAVATYEVLLDGKPIGTVTKHVEERRTIRNGKMRRRPSETCWVWHMEYDRTDILGYPTRAEAIKWLLDAKQKED